MDKKFHNILVQFYLKRSISLNFEYILEPSLLSDRCALHTCMAMEGDVLYHLLQGVAPEQDNFQDRNVFINKHLYLARYLSNSRG